MVNTNYIGIIVKILEIPKYKIVGKNCQATKFRAQFQNKNQNKILELICWGTLASELKDFYKINDYVLVEGYLFQSGLWNKDFPNQKLVKVKVVKIYPYLSKS
nr:hypothetical chloroplast RF41 [Haslea ostrearia]WAJ48312.1 hypothetical protein DMDDKFKA_00116 [Haslea ostrearia]